MSQRIPSLRPTQIIRALERAGFAEARRTGSHVILYKEGHPRPVSVPMHNRELKRPLLFGIIKDAGLTPEEFQAFL